MLKYKISNGSNLNSNIHISNSVELYKSVNEDYRKYYDASMEDKTRYSFIIHAIYSCLIKANSNPNKKQGYEDLKYFLRDVESITKIELKAKRDIAGTISFTSKNKRKVLVKKDNKYKEAA